MDKEDELGWFSSDGATGGSGDMLESDFKFSCPESKAMENILEMVDGSSSTNNTTSICDESVSHMPFVNGSTRSNRKDEIEQVSECY